MRPFPDTFDPAALVGPRGREFPRREDAFQQLVGDGFRLLRGGLGVHVSTTRGRDGSIDVFIEPALGAHDQCLPELAKPLIVECKDHDEAGSDLRANLLAGWNTVAERLARQAAAGWPGNFSPWRSARSYVYAVSARLPTAQLRSDLRGRISGFFDALPARPPLERIEVLDWSDLRALWDGVPRLADRWLGVGFETLLGHAEQLERLTGFRAYLLESNLPFLAPPEDDTAHPDALFARLCEPGRERGLLLEGPGGVGKSRTLIEVAQRADAAGWRVLHAQAAEPALTDEDLEATVLAGPGPTLVLLDYLDQMKLDLVRLRRRLLPAARARNIGLALLANMRPGGDRSSANQAPPARSELFEVIPLRPTTERAKAIADRLLAPVAPHALERLGYERLAALCGSRPIVALFIAREIERRTRDGTLDEGRLLGIRSGDLTDWLRRRLAESDLAVPPAPSRLEPATPGPHLLAAAAILAAAPQSQVGLAAAGERALRSAGLEPRVDPADRSRRLIAVLGEMGWLESHNGMLVTAHDVVVDEIVSDVLVDRPATSIRRPELEMLLAPALSSARTLGRLAVALRRVLGTEGMAEPVAADLLGISNIWLEREAKGLGQMLSFTEADEASFALGAVIEGKPWADAALSSWDSLVAPFLSIHALRPSSRHVLYRGLSNLPEGRGNLLFPPALRWLEQNGRSLYASFVLGPLLGRKDLNPTDVRQIAGSSLQWLQLFEDQIGAQFVLRSLLDRTDLDPTDVRKAVASSLHWLKLFEDQIAARFVLRSLLDRTDLDPTDVRKAVASSLHWLKLFQDQIGAQFVLRSLLDRTDLRPTDVRKAVASSLHWLKLFQDQIGAQFVLHSLLARTDLDPTAARKAVISSSHWLELFEDQIGAQFVLHSLLARTDLDPTAARKAVVSSLHWLELFEDRIESTQFVLRPLLDRADLDPTVLHRAVSSVLPWLRDAGNQGLEADFLLTSLLSRNDLQGVDLLDVQRIAAAWIRSHPLEIKASFLLKSLLTSKDLHGEIAKEAVRAGVVWFTSNARHPQADFVFSRLLRSRELAGEERRTVVKLGIAWLREAPSRNDRDFAFSGLLRDAGLVDESDREFLVRDATDWLALQPCSKGTVARLKQNLNRLARMYPQESWAAVLVANRASPPAFRELTRVLGQTVLDDLTAPSEEWLSSALDITEERLDGEHAASAGFDLPALLPLTARLTNVALLARACLLGKRFLGAPTLTLRNRRGFAAACYRYLDGGAWPDREAAMRILTELGIERPILADGLRLRVSILWRLERAALRLATRSNTYSAPSWFDFALMRTVRTIGMQFPATAGSLLPSLLPLSKRFGSEPTRERLAFQVQTLLADPSFNEDSRTRFALSCYRFVDEGAWPDRKEGERALVALGIERPSTDAPD